MSTRFVALKHCGQLAVIAIICLGAVSCAKNTGTANDLLNETRTLDLSPQYPTSVRQTAVQRTSAPRRAELYPGDDNASTARRRGAEVADRSQVRLGADGYQLNFDNANVGDVARALLGDTLRIPYVLDPRVQGQMTFATGRPVSRDDLIKVFEAALRLNEGALVGDGSGGYRIIPIGDAAAGDISRVQPLRRGEGMPPGYGVTIMPLRHVSAEAMLRLLDGFLARAGSARAEMTGNMLLIRGSGRERESVADAVDTFDVDWLKGQSAGIFPLAHSTPDAIIQELATVMPSEQNSLNSNMVRFQPIPRLNAVLVLARRSDALQSVGAWIRRLDRSSSAGDELFVYQVENGKAVDLAQILNDTFGSSGGGIRRPRSELAPGRGTTTQSSPAFGQPQVGGLNALPTPTGATPVSQVDQRGPAPRTPVTQGPIPQVITGGTTSNGTGTATAPIDVRIVPDEANNTLLIRATQSDYQKILSALRQIDRPPMQVLINATIAEVTLNDGLRYGVQAFLKSGTGAHGAVGYQAGNTGDTNAQTLRLSPTFPGFNLLAGNIVDPQVVLDALASVTSVKVVSSPSVVVVDNQPATLKVGDEVPIATQQAETLVTSGAQPILASTIRFRETGVILKVTPRVNSSGLVTMDVEQEISQVANASTQTGTSLTPTISQRRIASTISVYGGQTVVLGGLISEQSNADKKSVPIVNRIPILGDLIGKTENERKRTELIVFIKPQVIRNSMDASIVSQDLRSQLKAMAVELQPDRSRNPDRLVSSRSVKDGN